MSLKIQVCLHSFSCRTDGRIEGRWWILSRANKTASLTECLRGVTGVYPTYDDQREQNETPDGWFEWLEDPERVGDVDVDVWSACDDCQSCVLERFNEVDDLLSCCRDCNRCGSQVRRVALISLTTNQRHTSLTYWIYTASQKCHTFLSAIARFYLHRCV